jgi:hypothetical protein
MSYGAYWIVNGGNGERFAWRKEPTYLCPHGYFERVREGDEVVSRVPTAAVEQAAAALGADVELLMRVMERVHASHSAGRRRVNGKLTGDCAICGARMIRKGFAHWKEVASDDVIARGFGAALGFDGHVRGVTRYVDTKREAEAWARENAAVSRSAALETSS